MRLVIISILLIILFALVVHSFGVRTIYNAFTGKLDYIRTGNFSGENLTADNIFIGNESANDTFLRLDTSNDPLTGNLDFNNSGLRQNVTGADYINEIQFWNVTNESTNVIWTIII